MEDEQKNRRNFLKFGFLAAGLTAAGVALNKVASGDEGAEEKVKVLTADGRLAEVAKSKVESSESLSAASKHVRQGIPGRKFIMVIDLTRCKNARKCLEGCQKMHNFLPPVEWLKVKEMQDSELSGKYWFPQLCYQCDNSPCCKVCPVGATFKRSDGIVGIDNERCIGCKFCMAACPYSSRSFNYGNPKQVEYSKNHPLKSCHTMDPNMVGTVSKCDFCPDFGSKGILPACVRSCPNGVIFYGDENEDVVSNGEQVLRLKDLLVNNGGYRQFEVFGTKPRVYYLPPVNRLFPFKPDPVEHNQEE